MFRAIRQRFRWLILFCVVVILIGVALFQFVTMPERRLFALDAASGKVAWSIPIELNWSSYEEPVIDNGHVIITTNDANSDARTEHWQVSAYDAGNGRSLWTYAPFGQAGIEQLCPSTINASPIVANGRVYVYVCAATKPSDTMTSDKTSLVALDESTGTVVWEHDEPTLQNTLTEGAPLTLRVLNGGVFILVRDKSGHWGVDVLDEKAGKSARRIDLPDLSVDDPPSFPVSDFESDGQTLYVNLNGLRALDPLSGKVRYTLQVRDVAWTAKNGVYATSYVGPTVQIAAYDAKTGAVRWQRTLDKTLAPNAPDDALDVTIQMRADAQTVYAFVIHHQSNLLWLVALNSGDGSTRWIKPVQIDPIVADVLAKVAISPDLVAYNEVGEVTGIRVLAASDGSARWFFPAYTKDSSPSTDGQRIYLFDESARYRNWLVALNPAWHG